MCKLHGYNEQDEKPGKNEVFAFCKDVCSFLVTMTAITGLFLLIAPTTF